MIWPNQVSWTFRKIWNKDLGAATWRKTPPLPAELDILRSHRSLLYILRYSLIAYILNFGLSLKYKRRKSKSSKVDSHRKIVVNRKTFIKRKIFKVSTKLPINPTIKIVNRLLTVIIVMTWRLDFEPPL